VQTIPRRGYRFIAPVEAAAHPSTPNGKHMLVVLPFENLSGAQSTLLAFTSCTKATAMWNT
jgi:DNA-binding winged helix-turn-helix (wHTH) protein